MPLYPINLPPLPSTHEGIPLDPALWGVRLDVDDSDEDDSKPLTFSVRAGHPAASCEYVMQFDQSDASMFWVPDAQA